MTITLRAAPVAALLAVAALAGCSSPHPRPAPSPPPSAVAASSAPASAAPSPTGPVRHALGETVAVTGDDRFATDATVYAYRQPVADSAPRPEGQPGYTWGAADVQACLRSTTGPTVAFSEAPWSVRTAAGGVIGPADHKYAQFPQPAFPILPLEVQTGGCVRGWIVFAVPAGERPVAVEYAPQGRHPVEWATG